MKDVSRIASVCLLALGLACSHTKKVETPAEVANDTDKPKTSAPTPKRAEKTAAKDPMPLASDPLQMLTPKGRDQLKQALQERGFLKSGVSVSEALRKLQAKEGYPETGMPDDDSLLKLGLQPNDVVVRVRPAT